MKVVLFCGGMGLRMGEHSRLIPKPLVPVGSQPILWHIMKYYAHFGHTEFIICLGHQADAIKGFFLNYNEALVNDFVLSDGGSRVELMSRDFVDWRITFVDTGLQSSVGERLRRVRPYLEGDDYFLAHYADTVTDAPLPVLIDELVESGKVGNFLCVRPVNYSFHTVDIDAAQQVSAIRDVRAAELWINGGFFVFRSDIFEVMEPGEELVNEPFQRLIKRGDLLAHRYEGFWAPMDTLKDKQRLESLAEAGTRPWAVWEANGGRNAGTPTEVAG